MGLYEEGIQEVKEALGIYEQLGEPVKQAECLQYLARLLYDDERSDAAEEAASRAISLFLEKGEQFLVCGSHRVLGNIHHSKGEREKAIHHFEAALEIASSFNWHDHLFWVHYALAHLFSDEDEFDDAHAHIGQAKSHAVDNVYFLGRAMELQADFWYRKHRFEEAKAEVLRAAAAYEKVGAATDAECCRELLQNIQKELNSPVALDF